MTECTALYLEQHCAFAPSSVPGDHGTYVSSSIFYFRVLRIRSINHFLFYHLVILYVQDKGSLSLSLDATCHKHGVRVVQNLERVREE